MTIIGHGDWVVISTARGSIETRALVTDRVPTLTVGGRRLYQVGMPWHYGYEGLAKGAVANDLTTLVEDPDSFIHEAKALTCAVRPGRLGEPALTPRPLRGANRGCADAPPPQAEEGE